MATKIGSNLPDILDGTTANDLLFGLAGNDILSGLDGNDVLDGGLGADQMSGGFGNDIYIVDDPDDEVIENPGEGADEVRSSIDYILGNDVDKLILTGTAINGTGNDLRNTIIGNGENNLLEGLAGNDVIYGLGGDDTLDGGLGSDGLVGGLGDDFYIVDNPNDRVSERLDEGIDTIEASVSYTLAANVEQLLLTGTNHTNGTGNDLTNTITGNNGNNTLQGLAGDDNLNGGEGDDRLDGGAGDDNLRGGLGNDTYVVDSDNDLVEENPGEGLDTVFSSINYILGSNLENLILTGSLAINGTGNALSNFLEGNSNNNILQGLGGADYLYGLAGADTLEGGDNGDLLDGGLGDDSLIGGLGSDRYIVDSPNDIIIENVGEGNDRVFSTATYILPNNLEDLTLIGASNINGTGNNLRNVLIGNNNSNTLQGLDGDDELYGFGGNDILEGGNGNDRLDAGSGVNTLRGGAGNDTYILGNSSDRVEENSGEGTDLVFSHLTYFLPNHVENLTLTGTNNINGIGNNLRNTIIGNAGNNRLEGRGSNDTLYGEAGNDRIDGGTGNDGLVGGDGNDTLIGGDGSDRILGGENDDVLVGGNGNDQLIGGNGQDSFILSGSSFAQAGIDGIADFVGGTDTIQLSKRTFAALTGSSSELSAGEFASVTDNAAAAISTAIIVYNSTNGLLFYNPNGDTIGFGGGGHFATLSGAPSLTNTDFILV
ncbi:MAG: calcium-binding protein [Coleofasciculus sp. G3-WIS-01]|uniref:calcium-binding protein n=1 Tax=Coleofasciculus sp. G3-WIS-01 TaxID=3069528 RepID=UPI0032FD1E27